MPHLQRPYNLLFNVCIDILPFQEVVYIVCPPPIFSNYAYVFEHQVVTISAPVPKAREVASMD